LAAPRARDELSERHDFGEAGFRNPLEPPDVFFAEIAYVGYWSSKRSEAQPEGDKKAFDYGTH
jgi:hypothetical protein